jgi:hypothetical protein
MPRIIDPIRFKAASLFFLLMAAPLGAQGAYLSDASLEAEEGEPGGFVYRLEIAYAQGYPGIEPKVAVDEVAGIEITSLAVKPLRKAKSEILIRFKAASASGWTFPELNLSWMAERLVIPPRAGPIPAPAAFASADSSPAPLPKESLPAWKAVSLPISASSARAIGSFAINAAFDRESAGSGDIAYLEFSLEGLGDFARAGIPRARIISGKARLGKARRYPDYDPQSGRGRLLFRFPLEASSAGMVEAVVEAYPVYDPERRELLPDAARALSIRILAPAKTAADAAPAPSAAIKRKGLKGHSILIVAAFMLALGLGLAGIALVCRSKDRRRIVPAAVLLGLCALIGISGGLMAALPESPEKSASDLLLGPNLRIYSVPSEKARFWTDGGSSARITGQSAAENGEIWYSVILEDSSSGWIRSEDAGERKAAP